MDFQVFSSVRVCKCVRVQDFKTLASVGSLLLYLGRLWILAEAAHTEGKECGRVFLPCKIHPSYQEECPVRQLDSIRGF